MNSQRSLSTARALSVVQGVVWLAMLMHGGWALVFAPLAVLAAFLGGRYPALGAALLIAPVTWLTLSWAPILARMSAGDWSAWAALVMPAALASILFAIVAVQRIRPSIGGQHRGVAETP